jgi:aminopeptidase N
VTRGAIKEDFILAELNNAVRYFAELFGRFPYPAFGAAIHPFGFGQGFPTLLMIPPADQAGPSGFSFIAHETAHQWWGNIVSWRSYRDQWLSEGFAEYSGILYAGQRMKSPEVAANLLRVARESLKNPPRTVTGVGRGRLNDIGPIILGHRLNTSKSYGAYQALIYNKGALVLRMLHYLFSHPSTGDERPFFVMMRDFVERYRNKSATTEDFFRVAGEHFARTPIAQRYGLKDLDWFFRQWVLQTELPSYTLEYEIKAQADGATLLSGAVKQENAGPGWQMALPLVLTFPNNQIARVVVAATGPSTPVELRLPGTPTKVELDPAGWILSEKTTTRTKQ